MLFRRAANRMEVVHTRTKTKPLELGCFSSLCRNAKFVIILWILTVDFYQGAEALNLVKCSNALGMESWRIPDSAITASSSYKDQSVGPKSARIRQEISGGAWCPKEQITMDSYEYLQIDLDQLTVITKVEVQGRFGNGQGKEFAEHFLLEYQREDDGEWIRFRDRRGREQFNGNTNTYLAEVCEVSPPIICKRIRFIPYSLRTRTVCMRVELYGCNWNDSVVAYTMPQGDKRGSEVDLFDFTYDGIFNENYLSGGLGQLTDGDEGTANFRLDQRGLGIKGYEWVGWKNDSHATMPIEIVFKFDQIRNFSMVIFHCNNYYSKDVRVFRKAEIFFSVGGKYFSGPPVVYEFQKDSWIEYARNVEIFLNHTTGKYVKVVLYFDAKWMMISEVKFISEPANGNFTMEAPPPTTFLPTTSSKNVVPSDISDINVDKPEIDVGIGRKYDNDHPETKETATMKDDHIGIIIGALGGLLLVFFVVLITFIIRHKRMKQNNNRRSLKPVVDRHIAVNLSDLQGNTNGKISNGNVYNSVATDDLDVDREICNGSEKLCKSPTPSCPYSDPKDSIQGRELPDFPSSSEGADSRDYAVPDVTKSALVVALPPQPPQPPLRSNATPKSAGGTPSLMTNSLDKPPTYDALYAAADVINNMQVPNIPSLQGVSGNNVYAVPNAELLLSLEHSVMQFPRDSLQFIEVLGEGQFGEVHLCEAINCGEFINDEYFGNRTSSRPVLVAVKMLRRNADDRARSDFHKEIKIMSQLKDPNIVRVLGVCTHEEPLCMIVEYMKYGDLNQFLLDHVPESPVAQATNAKTLSYGCLIYMASQIASGMKYLESLNMVHRDLATRNCLVGTNFTIKISDFGMSRSLYSADYYRIEGRAVLPIRWMAWESILLGKFTTKSDVWSFAVTLWEVLTFAKDQPFDNLTDEQVIENAGHYYRNDNKEVYLPQPSNCPKEIFDLMYECWNRNECYRPSYREIHMFLQRKNMGYNPKDEMMNQIRVPIC
ncbi:discoidin domain-containing receptor 2-like isoform X1 [Argopecten irradians]|uniref:discoidin domain-containing receptor 2-like isoform X1 n=1 Tax=Argopecten irradians TaxID=31199 RepID=UPI003723CDBE